jgi:hypothetical protein
MFGRLTARSKRTDDSSLSPTLGLRGCASRQESGGKLTHFLSFSHADHVLRCYSPQYSNGLPWLKSSNKVKLIKLKQG